ncbi:MAG: hypothetical protein K6B65_05755 [Bacilli bacterium]|nr:hypothetical protein [Bacilli bacterium]
MREVDLLLLGDSLVKRGYWEGLFPGKSVFNYGLDGDTTLGLMQRVRREFLN